MPLREILERPQTPARTAALAEWIQSLFGDGAPVLIGGAAVLRLREALACWARDEPTPEALTAWAKQNPTG